MLRLVKVIGAPRVAGHLAPEGSQPEVPVSLLDHPDHQPGGLIQGPSPGPLLVRRVRLVEKEVVVRSTVVHAASFLATITAIGGGTIGWCEQEAEAGRMVQGHGYAVDALEVEGQDLEPVFRVPFSS